jgi:hypothetical protein
VSGWRLRGTAVAGTVAVIVALLLAGSARGLALLAYVLFLGALALMALVAKLRVASPLAPRFDELVARPAREERPIGQLVKMQRLVNAAGWDQSALHHRLRPVLQEVLAARLSRQHGVDLEREPARARSVVGEGPLWELVRPDRRVPEDRGRGLSRRELEALLDELERV